MNPSGLTDKCPETGTTRAVGEGRAYVLPEGVRVFRGASGEVRFRRGVWNFTEAVLNCTGQPEVLAAFFTAVAEALILHRTASIHEISARVGVDERAVDGYLAVLENLVQRRFLARADDADRAEMIRALFGGTVTSYAEGSGEARPVAFFSDNRAGSAAARAIADEAGIPLDLLDQGLLDDLCAADLTTRTEALSHARSLETLGRRLDGYFAVMGCVAEPNLTMLRNLNRLLVAAEKPLILGLVDGPFVTVLSTLAKESGCLECYEQRMMARLEDTAAYQEFVRRTIASGPVPAAAQAPSMHLLTSAVMAEGILYSTTGMLRLAGRAISVYLPLLEIQAQDILRVPYCPACGHIAVAQMDEMYRSSNRLVSEMLSGIELTEGQG